MDSENIAVVEPESTCIKYEVDVKTSSDLENWFVYHTPKGGQAARYEHLRKKAKALAYAICECCPPCADRTVALRALRDTTMNANQAIACNE